MQNLTGTLDTHARRRPLAEALVFKGQRIGWGELRERVLCAAQGLSMRGIGIGTIVAMAMKNSAAFVEISYALSHLGAVALPINFRLSADEMVYITGHAGAALMLVDEELAPQASAQTIPVVIVGRAAQLDSRKLFGDQPFAGGPVPRQGPDLFRLMYTSGTTDRPKGVIHTYDNFHAKNLDLIIALQLSASDRLCVVGPLYHVGGADLPGLAVHTMGSTLVLLRDYDPAAVLQTIQNERISGIWLAPVMTNGLLAYPQASDFDAGSLRWCIGGGERTPESRIREFVAAFPNARYIDAYGMTETVSGDTLMEPGFELSKIGSVGPPVAHVQIEIRDDSGGSLPARVEGEICMRGPKVSPGYWRDPERTALALWPDGFLRSGDIGFLDEDGFLYLTDRKKDLIISGGENVASSEVERVIYEHPAVLEAAVIGRPDAHWGEVPVAVVVVREGMSLDLDALAAHCRRHLAGFKCPKDLILTDRLPRNPSGKVLKRLLRDRFAAK